MGTQRIATSGNARVKPVKFDLLISWSSADVFFDWFAPISGGESICRGYKLRAQNTLLSRAAPILESFANFLRSLLSRRSARNHSLTERQKWKFSELLKVLEKKIFWTIDKYYSGQFCEKIEIENIWWKRAIKLPPFYDWMPIMNIIIPYYSPPPV